MDSYQSYSPGDVIWRIKDGLFQHPAIVVSSFHVYENTPERGEHISNLSEFIAKAKGQFRVVSYDALKRALHLQKVQMELLNPRKWSILNNCQDSISRITDGEPKSIQRDILLFSAAAVGLAVMLKKAA